MYTGCVFNIKFVRLLLYLPGRTKENNEEVSGTALSVSFVVKEIGQAVNIKNVVFDCN